ncbi:hypothetical protein BGZ51_000824 [Haplosporangium sp. Z 767]|nr:hypothetical protein BGZ51_000824 [Haplosporangium sp. Z 767]KAF9189578.1 hypothetical protein BGZ50_000678 [Haplosporangium sp. Z 11]
MKRRRGGPPDKDKERERARLSHPSGLNTHSTFGSSFLDESSQPPQTHGHEYEHTQQEQQFAQTSSSTSASAAWLQPSMTRETARQLGRSLQAVISYFWDLIVETLLILRPLFSILLALVILIMLLSAVIRSLVVIRSEVHTRIVCKIPWVSYFVECPVDGGASESIRMGTWQVPDFTNLVNKQAASYELIMDSLSALNSDFLPKKNKKAGPRGARKGKSTRIQDSNEDGDDDDDVDSYGMEIHSTGSRSVPLALLLKRAEIAVVDLKTLVKHSSLTEDAKSLLVGYLQVFHEEAKKTSRKLQFLQARANGCVDGLVIRNVYLTIELDRLEALQRRLLEGDINDDAGQGMLGKAADMVWDLFTGSNDLQLAASEKRMYQLYEGTMEEARKHLRDLIFQTQDVLQNLDSLDRTLEAIRSVAVHEEHLQGRAQRATLADLWTHLGGNRLEVRMHRENMALLKAMEGHQKATTGQVQTALWKLTDFEAEIGVLREKVVDAAVDMAMHSKKNGGRQVQPHVVLPPKGGNSGQNGEDNSRTNGGQFGASSLRVHIQQINQVTSRLKERSFLSDGIPKPHSSQQQQQADRI